MPPDPPLTQSILWGPTFCPAPPLPPPPPILSAALRLLHKVTWVKLVDERNSMHSKRMETKSSVFVPLLRLFLLALLADVLRINASETTLYLLNVVPYPDDRPFAGWDRGFELIPAGDLAIEQINNKSDLLPGYRLELVDIESEACGISIIYTTGYVNLYRHLVQPNSLVVGVVGLFCSTVTAAISPVASHPGIDYIQVAGSTSPLFQNVNAYPRLYHTISSSTIFNKAILRLMDKFGWKRISSIHDNSDIYSLATADDFVSKVNADSTLKLVTRISTSLSDISDAFANLPLNGARIVYASLTTPGAANLMCEAYKRGFLWPGYVYIFHEHIFQILLKSNTTCDERELREAFEGIFLLHYRLHAEPHDTLVSGWTYEEYHENYLMRLAEFATTTGMQLQDNSYANVLHDEVWAIALALNNSLETLKSLNVTLADYGFGQSIITDTIASKLKNISFQGAASYIEFDSNQEAGSSINIFQVQRGQPVLVGVYNPNENNLTITDLSLLSTVPVDQFEVVYEVLPQWLMITIFCICGLAYIMTTVILVLFLYWRNEPEIKATSLYLSLVMFAGCYLVYTAIIFQTVHRAFVIRFDVFTAICNIDVWFGFIGYNLIIGTLFVKLLRINHVFGVFRKTSKLWSDQFLFLGVLLICSGILIILILWTIIDILHLEERRTYIPSAQPPYYQSTRRCTCRNLGIWVMTAHAYNGVIILLVMFLAVQTRHIKWCNFKDTKKVNAYIFTVVAINAIAVPLWYIFIYTQVEFQVGGHISSVIAYLSIAMLCQLFLFAPKTLPLFNKCEVCTHH